jgi:hypothetical protein
MINTPNVDANDYIDDSEFLLTEDSETAAPKHGTIVQSGWAAAEAILKPQKAAGGYPLDFKFSTETQLLRFLDDEPFATYNQHWIEREGKKSFVCIGDDCPLCTMLGDKPRGRISWNVLVLSDEEPGVQILTASPGLARMLLAANSDPKRGPLTKYFWAVSRQGTGPQTQYSVERVKAHDLVDEWELNPETVDTLVSSAVKHDANSISVTPRSELLAVAKSILGQQI